MIIQTDRSGDYGSAIRGDDVTVPFNDDVTTPPFTGGYDAIQRLRDGDNVNRIAVTLGAILIVALIFLCFRLAFDGVRQSSVAQKLTGQQYLDDSSKDADSSYHGPSKPVGGRVLPPGTVSFGSSQPQSIAPPAPMTVSAPVAGEVHLFVSPEAEVSAQAFAGDCRTAYNLSGECASKWYAAVNAAKNDDATDVVNQGVNAAERAAAQDGSEKSSGSVAPHPLTSEEWRTIDTQIEGILSSVAFATRPASFPDALQELSSEFGREMRVYLQTTRLALAMTDTTRRAALQSRAEAHRQKAGEYLGRLESAVKSGTTPAEGSGGSNN